MRLQPGRSRRHPVRVATAPLLIGLLIGAAGCGRSGERAAQDVLHAIDQGKLIGTRGSMEGIGKALTAYTMDRGGYPQGGSIQEACAALVPTFLPSPVTV